MNKKIRNTPLFPRRKATCCRLHISRDGQRVPRRMRQLVAVAKRRVSRGILSCIGLVLLLSLAAGCVKVKKASFVKTLQGIKNKDDMGDLPSFSAEAVQLWHASPRRVVVLFGYGYSDAESVSRTVESLCAKYGAAEDGGLIIPLVFPDDFSKGKDSVASELPLYALSDDTELIGILLLGAGENTNYGIAHIQDKYNGERAFPVFSLFPQDDVLGSEATSDFVLDRLQEAKVSGSEEEEAEDESVPEASMIIERSIEYFIALSSMLYPDLPCAPLPWDDALLSHVMDIVSPLSVSRYMDGETGLKSVNHFVLE